MSSATDTLQELRLLLEDQVRRSGETNQVLGEGGGERRGVKEGGERRTGVSGGQWRRGREGGRRE